MLDNGLRDCCFCGARTLGWPPNRNHWRGDRKHFATHNRSPHFHVKIDIDLSLQTQTLDRLLAARAQLPIIRTLVYDRGVVVSNIGNVGCLINDRDVALARHHRALDLLCPEFARWHEAILVGTDVVIVISPIVNAAAAIEARFRRERRPADVFIALAPGNPSRRPFIAGHPNPADIAQPRPASIMIRCPTERFFGDPSPAGVGVNPATVRVGMPAARTFRFTRLPHISVIRCFAPIAVAFEFRIKNVVAATLFRTLAGRACD